MKISNKKSGFTLIELLVVISIIGFLSTVVMQNLNGARLKARDTVRMSDMRQIQKAIEMYYSNNGHYPAPDNVTNASCWVGGGGNWINDAANYNWSTGYLSRQPHDPIDNCCWPWGNAGCGVAGDAASYEYWSDGTKYLLAVRLENTSSPYRAERTGAIDPRSGQPYSSTGWLGKYCFVVTN